MFNLAVVPLSSLKSRKPITAAKKGLEYGYNFVKNLDMFYICIDIYVYTLGIIRCLPIRQSFNERRKTLIIN